MGRELRKGLSRKCESGLRRGRGHDRGQLLTLDSTRQKVCWRRDFFGCRLNVGCSRRTNRNAPLPARLLNTRLEEQGRSDPSWANIIGP